MSRRQKTEEEQAEETAVPDVDVVGETFQDLSEAGARIILPHPEQPARPGLEPRAAKKKRRPEEEEYHVGGARGPQDPGPWGSDEAIRNRPAWGIQEDNPMEEGSE